MLCGVIMLGGVFSLRAVAAADMAAAETNAQMNPGFAQPQTFFAAFRIGLVPAIYVVDMWASWFQVDLHGLRAVFSGLRIENRPPPRDRVPWAGWRAGRR